MKSSKLGHTEPAQRLHRGRRILIIRQGYYPEDPRVRREAEALAAAGYRVQVLCLRNTGQKKRELCGQVEAIRLPLGQSGRKRAGALRYLIDYTLFFALANLACSLLNLRHSYALVQVNTMPDALVWGGMAPEALRPAGGTRLARTHARTLRF